MNRELGKIPEVFLAKLLKAKLKEGGYRASNKLACSFASHLLKNPELPFHWGRKNEPETVIEITDEEFASLTSEIEKFCENDLPDIIIRVQDKLAGDILNSLKEDWPCQKAFEGHVRDGFKDRLEEDWGTAFDSIRLMLVISRESGNEFIKWISRSQKRRTSAKYDCLLKLHARGCQVTTEIMCLMENGLADGAFARWRTLHEIAVVTTILADSDDELAQRYLDHESIDAKRSMDYFKLNYQALGYEKPDAAEIERIEAEYLVTLARYGNAFGSQYGWIAPHLGLKKATFLDLEKAVGQISTRSYYLFAGYNVHAAARGINFRLGLIEQNGTILSGMSNVGFFEPANNTAHSLARLNICLMEGRWNLDQLVTAKILLELRNSVAELFHKAQSEVETRHEIRS